MSLKTWWLAFVGALAVLVLIALSIARMYRTGTSGAERRRTGRQRALNAKRNRTHHGYVVLWLA